MKNKKIIRKFTVLLAALVIMCGFSVTAYAGGGDESDDTPTPVTEETPAPETPAPDVLVVTAPSRLHALLDGAPALEPESVPPVVAIGATTASACRALNLRHVQADSPSPRDLARAAVSLI